jgi:hypothetical protein
VSVTATTTNPAEKPQLTHDETVLPAICVVGKRGV